MLGKVTFKSNALQYALCFKVIHYVFFSPELGLFISFFNNKKPTSYIFANCEDPFTPKVK